MEPGSSTVALPAVAVVPRRMAADPTVAAIRANAFVECLKAPGSVLRAAVPKRCPNPLSLPFS